MRTGSREHYATLAREENSDSDHELVELRQKLGGCEFYVDDDPDNNGFFSVFCAKDGAGCEVAGKIGEKCVASHIASSLAMLCR